jgi:hypothetical protein
MRGSNLCSVITLRRSLSPPSGRVCGEGLYRVTSQIKRSLRWTIPVTLDPHLVVPSLPSILPSWYVSQVYLFGLKIFFRTQRPAFAEKTSKFCFGLLYFKTVFRHILIQRGVVKVLGSTGVGSVFIGTSTALPSYCWSVWSLSSM